MSADQEEEGHLCVRDAWALGVAQVRQVWSLEEYFRPDLLRPASDFPRKGQP